MLCVSGRTKKPVRPNERAVSETVRVELSQSQLTLVSRPLYAETDLLGSSGFFFFWFSSPSSHQHSLRNEFPRLVIHENVEELLRNKNSRGETRSTQNQFSGSRCICPQSTPPVLMENPASLGNERGPPTGSVRSSNADLDINRKQVTSSSPELSYQPDDIREEGIPAQLFSGM